ncbi:MAG: septum formation initiator family protein [Bacteroidetes bacterium]|nr:septum formation initiator family protein [Bacteroidota bacterium]
MKPDSSKPLLTRWLKKALPIVRNKYFIAIVAFMVWLTFFDQHNLISQYSYRSKLSRLQQSVRYYKEEIIKSRSETEQLMHSDKSLEQFAREKYFMKKDNEDIFVIAEE